MSDRFDRQRDANLDPFDPAADPYGESAVAHAASEGEPSPQGLEVSRRSATMLMVGAVVLPVISSCVPHRLACETLPAAPASCRHKHCRYYRGP
ncbi:MAG: hypothetical protein GY811_08820 [Myxococcales bacterium]|nr:hypothetical protein [Myxococcales bacterium]